MSASARPSNAPPVVSAQEIVDALGIADIGYMVCDAAGLAIAVSEPLRRSTRYPLLGPLPAIPWFMADAAPRAVKAEREAGWRALIRTRKDWRGWVRWHRQDGEVRILEGTARVLTDGRVLMIANDRTDRFEGTRALAEAEAAQRTILDDLPLSVALQDPEGRFLYVNNYLPRRLGLDRERIVGRLPSQIGVFRPEPEVEAILTAARARVEPMTGRIVEVATGPLAGTQWAFYGVPITDRDGSLRQYLSVAAERTAEAALAREREEFARAIARTQRVAAVNDFAGALAHELSNALQPVAAYASRLAANPDRPDRAELARRIDAAAMTAGRILRRTLTVGRVEEGTARPGDVKALIEGVLETARDLAPPGLTYRLTGEGQAMGLLQATEFRQVLLNLLNNAADAQHYTGEIGIEIEPDREAPLGLPYRPMHGGPFVTVTITDQGGGVPEKAMSRIFEPFFTSKGEGRGTGLGLPVALGLVTGWGGTISVASPPQEGARFTVWIPHAATKGETSCPPS